MLRLLPSTWKTPKAREGRAAQRTRWVGRCAVGAQAGRPAPCRRSVQGQQHQGPPAPLTLLHPTRCQQPSCSPQHAPGTHKITAMGSLASRTPSGPTLLPSHVRFPSLRAPATAAAAAVPPAARPRLPSAKPPRRAPPSAAPTRRHARGGMRSGRHRRRRRWGGGWRRGPGLRGVGGRAGLCGRQEVGAVRVLAVTEPASWGAGRRRGRAEGGADGRDWAWGPSRTGPGFCSAALLLKH